MTNNSSDNVTPTNFPITSNNTIEPGTIWSVSSEPDKRIDISDPKSVKRVIISNITRNFDNKHLVKYFNVLIFSWKVRDKYYYEEVEVLKEVYRRLKHNLIDERKLDIIDTLSKWNCDKHDNWFKRKILKELVKN